MPDGLKFGPDFLQIGGVFGDLRTDRVRAIGSRRPAIGHMQQHHAALCELRELL